MGGTVVRRVWGCLRLFRSGRLFTGVDLNLLSKFNSSSSGAHTSFVDILLSYLATVDQLGIGVFIGPLNLFINKLLILEIGQGGSKSSNGC